MGIGELLLLAVGLSMDAFAVSVCKGLSVKKAGLKESVVCGGWFGGFQALMPLIGYLLGTTFESVISSIAGWVAFILLGLIGGVAGQLGDLPSGTHAHLKNSRLIGSIQAHDRHRHTNGAVIVCLRFVGLKTLS